jgi:hypothetical protein
MAANSWAVPDWLPPGRLIVPSPKFPEGTPATDPVLWITDEPVVPDAAESFARLLGSPDTPGLWPLLLTTQVIPTFVGMRPELNNIIRRSNPPGRPWLTGDLYPRSAEAIGELDASELLHRGWEVTMSRFALTGFSVPFQEWPGLADPMPPGTDPSATAALIAMSPDGLRQLTGRVDPDAAHIGFVPAADGAAAIAACGWTSNAGDPVKIAAVVRSWQQRFGVRLCSLGFDLLCLSVAWPPVTAEQARRVAAEHFAFCPDIADFSTFTEYAASLEGASVWQFWWD